MILFCLLILLLDFRFLKSLNFLPLHFDESHSHDFVTIASPLNLPATMPEHAIELYSKHLTSLLELLIKDGALQPDFSDEVISASCVTREVQN